MTSTLTAVSYHDAVLDMRGSLTVRAVFDRAWHVHDRDGRVLTVAAAPYDGPMSVRIARNSTAGVPIRPGMRGWFECEVLVVGPTRIDLARAAIWSPLSAPVPPIVWEALSRDVITIGRLIPANDGYAAGLAWRRRAERSMAGLHGALVRSETSAAREYCRSLIGLGPGLTPAGDDIVVGALTTLHILGRRLQVEGPELAAEIGRGLAGESMTTPLSRTLLSWAAQGVAAQPLLDVLLTLGGSSAVRGIDALLAIGHSSGQDMLTGAHLAASAILRREEKRAPAMAGQA